VIGHLEALPCLKAASRQIFTALVLDFSVSLGLRLEGGCLGLSLGLEGWCLGKTPSCYLVVRRQ